MLVPPFLFRKQQNTSILLWGGRISTTDSLISNYRAEFIGRGKLPKRQQRLFRYMLMLQRVAQIYQVAIVITNQINSSSLSSSRTARPAGGHILEHPCSYRIYLKQHNRDRRLARVVDSPFHFADYNEASFVISKRGVSDP
jgi:DNA repair protein RadA